MTRHLRRGLLGEGDKSSVIQCRKTPGYCWPTPSTEIGVPNMPSLKAKKLSKLPREKVLLEL